MAIHRRWREVLIWVGAVTFVLFLAVHFMLVLDDPNGFRSLEEVSAVGHLRTITTLQSDYAAAHPAQGFACHLPLLKPAASSADDVYTDSFLSSGDHLGYRFALSACQPGQDRVVRRYRVTAVPAEPGKSGVRAFCTDQTGALWYDAKGSAENCLAARRAIGS